MKGATQMRKFLVWFASGLFGLLTLSIAAFVMPPLLVGYLHTEWDPQLLGPGQEVMHNGKPLAERWPDLSTFARGRYFLALSRYVSLDDCVNRTDGSLRFRLNEMRNEYDLRVCTYLILEDSDGSEHFILMLRQEMFDVEIAEFGSSGGERRWIDFKRRFSSFAEVYRTFPTVSDWMGVYLLQKTVFAWLSDSRHFDLTLRLRYKGEGRLPQRIVVNFTGISK